MAYNTQPYSTGSSLWKGGKINTPRVDTIAASMSSAFSLLGTLLTNSIDRPFFQQDQLTPASSASPSRSASPLTPHDRLRLPFGKSSRGSESPIISGSFSPAQLSSNLDSAFPRFPTAKFTASPRLKSAHGAQLPRCDKTDSMMSVPTSTRVQTTHPKIAPNPLSSKKIDTNTSAPLQKAFEKASSPKEEPTPRIKPVVGRVHDIISPPLTAEPESIDQTHSRASGHSRTSTSSSSGDFPLPPRKGYGGIGLSFEVEGESRENTRPEAMRSQTFPRRKESLDFHVSRWNPSVSSSIHGRHASHDRGRKISFSGPDISRALLPPRGASLIRGRSGQKVGDVSSLPGINLEAEFGANNPYHSSSDSHSSIHSHNSSISQGSKTSSRSSPPSTATNDFHRRQQSNPRMSDLMSEITSSMANISPNQMYPRPSGLEPVKEQEPYSHLSLAFQSPDHATNPITRLSPIPRIPSPAPLNPRNREPSPAPLNPRLRNLTSTPFNAFQGSHAAALLDQDKGEPLPAPRRPLASKGNCKACTLPIKGKSVSSADGRLTGRYHKPCFVCTTCRSPFLTAEFYVLNDAPYCEQHYHQLNNSMCNGCDKGIEGQYLESEKEKFHPGCLKCADCERRLKNDYFGMDGRIFCERDAFRRAHEEGKRGGNGNGNGIGSGSVTGNGTASRSGTAGGMLGVGGETSKMEKRTTRLMMM